MSNFLQRLTNIKKISVTLCPNGGAAAGASQEADIAGLALLPFSNLPADYGARISELQIVQHDRLRRSDGSGGVESAMPTLCHTMPNLKRLVLLGPNMLVGAEPDQGIMFQSLAQLQRLESLVLPSFQCSRHLRFFDPRIPAVSAAPRARLTSLIINAGARARDGLLSQQAANDISQLRQLRHLDFKGCIYTSCESGASDGGLRLLLDGLPELQTARCHGYGGSQSDWHLPAPWTLALEVANADRLVLHEQLPDGNPYTHLDLVLEAAPHGIVAPASQGLVSQQAGGSSSTGVATQEQLPTRRFLSAADLSAHVREALACDEDPEKDPVDGVGRLLFGPGIVWLLKRPELLAAWVQRLQHEAVALAAGIRSYQALPGVGAVIVVCADADSAKAVELAVHQLNDEADEEHVEQADGEGGGQENGEIRDVTLSEAVLGILNTGRSARHAFLSTLSAVLREQWLSYANSSYPVRKTLLRALLALAAQVAETPSEVRLLP